MNKPSMKTLSLMLVAALALGGCGLFGKKESAAPVTNGSDPYQDQPGGSDISGTPAPVQIGGSGSSSAIGGAGGVGNVIYFEFDSTTMTGESQMVLNAAAQYLIANPAIRGRLEGHADERGTREYNIGLGERRANAVLQALVQSGVNASQLSVTSYGEERPANSGHDEDAWAQNRRVEIVR